MIAFEDRDDAGREDLLALLNGYTPTPRKTEWLAIFLSAGFWALQICWWWCK